MTSTSEAPETEDCFGCRLTGSATLFGLGIYFFNERSKLPRHDLGQRRWLLACAGSFAAAGVWRATTHLFETEKTIDPTEPQPWYSCDGCTKKTRAKFSLPEKPTQDQHEVDDK
ncbi:hypothetical protein PHMEG_00022281 [Phytophthora megakarya]|uniref:DUF4536 domain-containing protein n=1 Tax=Phytophthora megakarya TaxID=4795 RepID=A0A225VJV4_9STRA|nr:hypothetical protein PHMEG_00022281 [Phytophthora megakarya]